jgi:hypothetical protein
LATSSFAKATASKGTAKGKLLRLLRDKSKKKLRASIKPLTRPDQRHVPAS